MTGSAKAISFGDHSRLIRREVARSLVLRAYPERFAEYGQTAFELFWRVQFAQAKGSVGPMPCRLLVMHA